MFINISNHPSANWTSGQLASAQVYGKVVDLPFPSVDPDGDAAYIQAMCHEYLQKINDICSDAARLVSTVTVHIMGEMTFSFALINALQKLGATCVASTTERITTEQDGRKTSEFRFVQFRKYG
jgi:hypothetical protein